MLLELHLMFVVVCRMDYVVGIGWAPTLMPNANPKTLTATVPLARWDTNCRTKTSTPMYPQHGMGHSRRGFFRQRSEQVPRSLHAPKEAVHFVHGRGRLRRSRHPGEKAAETAVKEGGSFVLVNRHVC